MIDIPIPKLRDDLLYNVVEYNGNNLIIIYDEIGLIQERIAFTNEELTILKLIDGINSVEEIAKILNYEDKKIPLLLSFINNLANSFFLVTSLYLKKKKEIDDYLKSEIKDAVCAGTTYPENADELKKYVELILSSSKKSEEKYNVIFAPHLDYRTGNNTHLTYAKAFNSIDILSTELIILFGTAHYQSTNDFMFTKKNYKTPLGIINTDTEFLKLLEVNSGGKIHYNDLAHLKEHSLELHIVFLQYLFKQKIKVVPVLIGTPFEYLNDGFPNNSENYTTIIDSLKETIQKYGKKTLFLASGDLSHNGLKFGDNYDSEEKKLEIMNYDIGLIDSINSKNKQIFFNYVRKDHELKKVCGILPFYAMMDLTNPTFSKNLYYNFWYEEQTKSSVSICSMGLKTNLS